MAVWLWVVVLGCVWLEGEAKRPELVDSSVWFTNPTLLNEEYDAAVIQMDFDEPVYTNGHSFLCPESDVPCPELSCKACDWSGQEPTGCEDPTCCGPAQRGDLSAAGEWCASKGPGYETLEIGGISKRYTLEQGDKMFVRFFVPEEYHCRPLLFIPRPYFGTMSSSFSTLEAYPTFSTISGWRNGLNQRSFGFGQSSVLFCPNTTIHPEYSVGTYAGMLYGLTTTSFEIEILVSPEEYPLREPPVQLSCDDVPDDVMAYAATREPAFCVEDGKSATFDFSENEQVSLVLPVYEGCHTITFASASDMPTSASMSHHLFCLPSETHTARDLSNAGLFRVGSNGQTLILSACFEQEVTYLFCSIRILRSDPVRFSFSTIAPVVRKKMTDLPDASLAYMDALQAGWAVNFGVEKYTCVDYYTSCFDWLAAPSDNTVFLYPPPASPLLNTQQTFEDLQEFYRDSGLSEKKENRVSLVVVFQVGTILPLIKNVTTLSVALVQLTNEEGEVVNLPGGGFDSNPEAQRQYSISNFVSHIPFDQIPLLDVPPCDPDKYTIYQGIVADRLEEVGSETELVDVLALKYSLDAMNEALLARSCTDQVSFNLDTKLVDVLLTDTTDCLEKFATPPFLAEPCCNPFLSLVACCLPFDYNSTEEPYGEVADVSECGEPQCAQSYYEDLSFSLNHFQDASLGCTSGVTNPTSELTSAVVATLQTQYLICLQNVGFGDFYEGMDCQVDTDCDAFLGLCYEEKCVLPSLEEVEESFLDCYIQAMPSSFEFYLKRNILGPSVKDSSKNSTEFYEAVREAATVKDCVNPNNPLAIGHRTRYQGRPLDYACVTDSFYGLEWPEDFEVVLELCLGHTCLRSFACLLNASSCVFEICNEYDQEYIEATEETCPSGDCDINIDGDCDGSYCVYCPPNGDLPCLEAPEYTNKEACKEGIGCELPDGTIVFGLTEEECRAQGEGCTTDCAGNSCESILQLSGGCFLPSLTTSSDCSLYSSTHGLETEWFKESLCVLPTVLSQSECNELPSTEWETCQENGLGGCVANTTQKQFLGCYISLWHTCSNEEECEASGICSDRDFFTMVRSYDPVDVQYGACIGSGEYLTETKPFCGNTALYRSSVAGCIFLMTTNPTDCKPPTTFFFTHWVTPSLTKDECLANEIGYTGCQIYQDPLDILLWILDPEECSCRGGFLLNAWEWTPGIWKGGIPRDLEWKTARKQSPFEFKDALSFILLADWIEESSEQRFLYPVQSQIICESQSITNPVFTLACDCLADGGEVCYESGEQQKEIQMGLSEVCEGETTFVKDPSARVNFGTNSVSEGCSFLNISLIYRNWFAAPFVPPPLSFKWQEPRERGVVINKNDATVGEVLGDGVVLSFSSPSIIEKFDVCLRLGTDPEEYEIADFGYTTSELDVIYPLGMEKIKIEDREGDGVWYCSSFDFQEAPTRDEGTVRIFPINREENYEEEEDSYTNGTTRALCYTLGALYCLLGVCCFIGLLLFVHQTIKSHRNTLSLPNFCTLVFLILCIFRAAFMFLYPTGTFEFQPLSYFVIFEIPTFLLFSVLIFMIYSFKRLVYKKGFFPGNPTPILVIGWTLVWSMWVIVTIVYSEVILAENNGSSACEGRVEVSYDDEEQETRRLAIAYQSVIIAVTFALTSIFFYYTYLMHTNTKNKTSSLKQFVVVVGGSFNVAFFVRTVLLLVILVVDFASAAYLFCALFFTEVLMITFLMIQFNSRYFRALASAVATSQDATHTSHTSAMSQSAIQS